MSFDPTRPIVLYDCETTGLDTAKDHVLEVALGLFSVEHVMLIRAESILLYSEDNPCQEINRLAPQVLKAYGREPEEAWDRVWSYITGRICVAHNSAFDSSWLPHSSTATWVCSMENIRWPRGKPGQSLVQLCVAHGVGVGSAHRALEDVLLLARLFERANEMGYSPIELLTHALRPKLKYRALVSFENNQLAKDAGFRWNPEERIWWKHIVPEDLPGLALPFSVGEVDEA